MWNFCQMDFWLSNIAQRLSPYRSLLLERPLLPLSRSLLRGRSFLRSSRSWSLLLERSFPSFSLLLTSGLRLLLLSLSRLLSLLEFLSLSLLSFLRSSPDDDSDEELRLFFRCELFLCLRRRRESSDEEDEEPESDELSDELSDEDEDSEELS